MANTEIFDDVAFFFVLYAVTGLLTVPVTAYWIIGWLWSLRGSSSAAPAGAAGSAAASTAIHHINVKSGGAAGMAPGAVCKCAECARKRRALESQSLGWKRYLTVGWILFALCWILFIYLSLQIPEYSGSQMVQFEPFTILGVDHSATEREINKAYRQMSLKYHPDKNPGDAAAAQMFLLVSKAHQTLTDPKAQENMAKYGNPDGYQGSRVGLGLPRWLIEESNKNVILIGYFALLFIVPSVAVFVWWRKAKQFHESGTMKETVAWYYNFIPDTVSVKYLIELLAASAEYRVLEKTPTDPVLFRKLVVEVKDAMVKQKFPHAYIFKTNHLLHAYMMRVVQCVPLTGTGDLQAKPAGSKQAANTQADKDEDDSSDVAEINNDLVNLLSKNKGIQNDLRIILRPVHALLHTMYEVALARGFVKSAFCVIELMQLLSQAMWVHDSPLRQLPHLTDKEIRFAGKKGFNDLQRFKNATDKEKQKVFRDHSDQEWEEINTVAGLLPDVEVEHKHEVEDETGLFEGDVVLLTVTLTRANATSATEKKADDKPAATNGEADKKKEEPKPATAAAPVAVTAASAATAAAAGVSIAATVSADGKSVETAAGAPAAADAKKEDSDSEEDDDDAMDEKIFALAQRPEKKRLAEEDELVDAHAVRFPFPKRERWYIVLIATNERGQEMIVAQEKVMNFQLRSVIKLRFQAPPRKGVYQYELHVKNDSYVGCDRTSIFKVQVDAAPVDPKKVKKAGATGADGEVDGDDDDGGDMHAHGDKDDEEEEAPEPKWYYLWHSSLWELLLNAVILSVAFFFFYDWMQKKGYWQAYVDPILNRASKFAAPVFNALAPAYNAVIAPVLSWLDKLTTRNFKEEAGAGAE